MTEQIVGGAPAPTLNMAPATEAVSLQQSLEQIEAGIAEALNACDTMQGVPVPVDKAAEALSGAGPSAMRCQASLANLNDRLKDIATRVGQL